MEEWRPIKESNNEYSVSNYGRIRRDVFRNRHTIVGKIKKPNVVGAGYLAVALYYELNGRKISCKRFVHKLILEAFVGPRPKDLIANHKDGNKKNNFATNLEWVTQSYNNRHAIGLGLRIPVHGAKHPLYKVPVTDPRHPMFGKSGERNPMFGKSGEKCPAAKLTQIQAEEIRRRRKNETGVSLAREFKVNRRTISNVCLGHSYKG